MVDVVKVLIVVKVVDDEDVIVYEDCVVIGVGIGYVWFGDVLVVYVFVICFYGFYYFVIGLIFYGKDDFWGDLRF